MKVKHLTLNLRYLWLAAIGTPVFVYMPYIPIQVTKWVPSTKVSLESVPEDL
jgi:hypothetical protein